MFTDATRLVVVVVLIVVVDVAIVHIDDVGIVAIGRQTICDMYLTIYFYLESKKEINTASWAHITTINKPHFSKFLPENSGLAQPPHLRD
jgi:hypothetical protein